MKCPVDGAILVLTERQGIEIDYCPECRGVWLDRGELDKIIERSDDDFDERPPPRRESERRPDWRDRRPDWGDRRPDRYDDDYGYRKKKRKSFLSDIFEFGD